MIPIKCETGAHLPLTVLRPFQGNLKRRTPAEIAALQASLKEDGLQMPFAVWDDGGTYRILDGHGRYAALVGLALEDASILAAEYPVVQVEAACEEDARKSLLQITSSYGTVNKEGIASFIAPIVHYERAAPVVLKAGVLKAAPVKGREPLDGAAYTIIRIKCPKNEAPRLKALLTQVDGVSIL
jgi:hypothetical protein